MHVTYMSERPLSAVNIRIALNEVYKRSITIPCQNRDSLLRLK